MLKHLNDLLCLQFKPCKWVLDYGKIEWYCGFKSFLITVKQNGFVVLKVFYHCQISSLFSLRCRSSHPEVFCRKGILRNFAEFTGKHLCQSLFLIKFIRPATLLKKRLWYKCFPMNLAKVPIIPFLLKSSGGCFCRSPSTILKFSQDFLKLVLF